MIAVALTIAAARRVTAATAPDDASSWLLRTHGHARLSYADRTIAPSVAIVTVAAGANWRSTEERTRRVSLLGAGAAHEFNGMITAILGNAEFALDARPKGGSLSVDLRGTSSTVTLTVSEPGCGMTEETPERRYGSCGVCDRPRDLLRAAVPKRRALSSGTRSFVASCLFPGRAEFTQVGPNDCPACQDGGVTRARTTGNRAA